MEFGDRKQCCRVAIIGIYVLDCWDEDFACTDWDKSQIRCKLVCEGGSDNLWSGIESGEDICCLATQNVCLITE